MNDDDRLVRIAADIADGARIEWRAVVASASSSAERELLDELQLLERLTDALSQAPSTPAASPAPAHAPADPQLTNGSNWGPLRIVEQIGRGTFGAVYRAFDSRLDREVALKLLRPPDALSSSAETLPASTVVNEGRLMARVRHPGVVTVYGAQRVDGQTGVWMELIDGLTLAQEVTDRGPLPSREVQQVGMHLADALAAVHRAGILHRDIKAQNVMREHGGRTVLMDFGTGLDLGDDVHALAGTPLYLAPEVIVGGEATARSDVYSLGVLLFYMATGKFPVSGATLGAIRRAHAKREHRSLRETGRETPRSLARVIDRAIASDPARRYASAHALADALRAAGPEARQRRLLMAVGVVAVATAGALSMASLRLGNSRTDPTNSGAGIIEVQIDPDLQRRAQIRGPAVGNWIPCHPRASLGIALCNLADGTIHALRMPAAPHERSPVARARLSADGNWLAYQWQEGTDAARVVTVNLIAVDGTRHHELYRTPEFIDIQQWTSDDQALIVRTGGGERQRVLLIPARGGPPRELMHLNGIVTSADLSPDGGLMLVTRMAGEQRDFGVIDTATGTELWTMAEPTDDFGAMWTPDGRGVVFLSDRTGCESVAFLPTDGGRPAGEVAILRDLGRNRASPFGFSSDGSYLLQLEHARRTAYRAAIDLDARTAGAPTALSVRCRDLSIGADWEPSGERVAFLSGPLLFGTAQIAIQSRDGRLEQRIEAPGSFAIFGRVRWAPGGRSLAVRVSGRLEADVLFLVDVATGESREIARGSDQRKLNDKIRETRWSPDGRTLYFQRDNGIRAFDVASSAERVIYRSQSPEDATLAGFDVRRSDGALVIQESVDKGERCLVQVMQNMQIRDRGQLEGTCTGAAWNHDGTRILAATFTTRGQVWVFGHEAGEPWKLPLSSDIFWDLSVSPDGRELLFSAGNPRPNMVTLKRVSEFR